MTAHSYSITGSQNIKANKNGQFSAQQEKALGVASHSYLKPLLWVIGGTVVLLIVVGLFLSRGNLQVLFSALLGLAPEIYLTFGLFVLTPIVILLWSGYRKTNTIARDVVENNIVAADGELVWRKDGAWGNSRYVAVTDNGRTLKSLFDDLRILPGKYRFHFLGRGGWILSAEKLSGDISDLLPALARAFNFTLEELQANRRGELTDRQARGLRSEMTSGVVGDMLDVFAKFGIIVVAILGLIVEISNLSFLTWAVVSLLYLAIILGLSGRKSIARYRPLLADLAEKHVESVDGVKRDDQEVDIYYHDQLDRNTVWINYLVVPKINQRFRIGRKGRSALVQTSQIDYRVYYTPHSRSLASLEPIQVTQDTDAESTEP